MLSFPAYYHYLMSARASALTGYDLYVQFYFFNYTAEELKTANAKLTQVGAKFFSCE